MGADALASELRWPPRTPKDFIAWALAASCVAAVPVLLAGGFVLVRALLALGFLFGLVPAWMVAWWPAW